MSQSASSTRTPLAGSVGVRRRRLVPCVLLFLGAAAGAAEAQATQLTVRVRRPNGNPINVATVCLAQGSQLSGYQTTDINGVTVFTLLPAGAYTLHVAKQNFETKSKNVNLSGTQQETVTLQPGTSTPPAVTNCQVGLTRTTLPPITITSFTVDNLPADLKVTSPPATHLPLRATFDRQPAFFRIKEAHPDAYTTPLQNLRMASWQPILAPNVQPFLLFPLNLARPYGTRVIYLQVNSHASEDGASQIKSVSVILTPAALRTSVLTGAALQEFLDRARQEGYGPVRPKGYLITPNPPDEKCPQGAVAALSPCGVFKECKEYLEKASFDAFAGPPLMPFWKITDLSVLHPWAPPSASGGLFPAPAPPPASISVSGYNMVNNPFQPPIQDPRRTISIERKSTQAFGDRCVVGPRAGPRLPGFLSVTVVGPDGRDPREAFPPRERAAILPRFPIPPRTLGPIRP